MTVLNPLQVINLKIFISSVIDKNNVIHYFSKGCFYLLHNYHRAKMNKLSPKHASKHVNPKPEVWVIDDNSLFKECISELLNNTVNLHCSYVFSRCEDAIKQLEISPRPDILLLDIDISEKNGINKIQKFKKLSPATKIIIITVLEDNDRIFKLICLGADGYLLKSHSLDKINEAINDVLTGGSPINIKIARNIFAKFAVKAHPCKDYHLTKREQEILLLITQGLTKKAIAEKLYLSHHTIDTHMRSLYHKLHVHKRSSAVSQAIKERLV